MNSSTSNGSSFNAAGGCEIAIVAGLALAILVHAEILTKKNLTTMQGFLRELLLHFIVIGGLFFLVYTAVNDTYENSTFIKASEN